MKYPLHKLAGVLFFYVFCVACSSDSVFEPEETFTLRGTVVTTPDNQPVAGVNVTLENEKNIVEKTQTDSSGKFTITVDKRDIDVTCKLYLNYNHSGINVRKEFEIKGFAQSSYDYGYIVLFDSRNPYNLPTFKYNGYIYLIHPVLREKYVYLYEAQAVCETLKDFDINSWFIPGTNELLEYFNSLSQTELRTYPLGIYITEDNQNCIRIAELTNSGGNYNKGDYYVSEYPLNLAGSVSKYVLPFSRY